MPGACGDCALGGRSTSMLFELRSSANTTAKTVIHLHNALREYCRRLITRFGPDNIAGLPRIVGRNTKVSIDRTPSTSRFYPVGSGLSRSTAGCLYRVRPHLFVIRSFLGRPERLHSTHYRSAAQHRPPDASKEACVPSSRKGWFDRTNSAWHTWHKHLHGARHLSQLLTHGLLHRWYTRTTALFVLKSQ